MYATYEGGDRGRKEDRQRGGDHRSIQGNTNAKDRPDPLEVPVLLQRWVWDYLGGVRTLVTNHLAGKERDLRHMSGIGKQVKGAVKKATEGNKGSSGSKSSSSSKGSSGSSKKGSGGSGADKAKRAAKEFLK